MASFTDNALLRRIAESIGAGPGSGGGIIVDGLATEDKQDSQISLLELLGLRPILDPNNSTATPLNAAGVFTGTWTDVSEYPSIRVAYSSNVAGVLQYQFSQDGVNVIQTIGFTFIASRSATITRTYRYFRIIYTNGGSNQTRFNLDTFLEPVALTSVSVSSSSDTELTAPITLSDAIPNPTIPLVGSAGLYWDGSVWARSRVDTYLDGLETKLDSLLAALPNTDYLDSETSGVNADLVAVLPGQADKRWRIYSMVVSYSADPTGGEVTVADETVTLFAGYITTGGLAPIYHQILGSEGEDVTITIAAGGAGIYSRLCVSARLETV